MGGLVTIRNDGGKMHLWVPCVRAQMDYYSETE